MTNTVAQMGDVSSVAADVARLPAADAGTIPLTASEDDMAAGLLARAFHSDPMMTYLVPDEQSRHRISKSLFAIMFPYSRRYGVAEMTVTRDAAAVWLKPGLTTITMGRMLRTGVLFELRKLGVSGFGRFGALMSFTEHLHKQAIAGDHWYLLSIGVEPERQGAGVGGRLISAGLQRVDADGLPCYLETDNPDNLPFYRRHGFEVAQEGQAPKGGPYVWAMVRR
jgi:ribosomal protein S18 acetylase RimI-like enzyme